MPNSNKYFVQCHPAIFRRGRHRATRNMNELLEHSTSLGIRLRNVKYFFFFVTHLFVTRDDGSGDICDVIVLNYSPCHKTEIKLNHFFQ